jgi:divalent metal cation (Fe/Co/Zn/Cd) transporter
MNGTQELNGLKRIIDTGFITSLAITPISIIFSKITGSGTLMIYFIWTAAGIAVKLFSLISVRIMLKENRFMFPHGPGKLENFSSFFFGLTILPIGGYFLADSAYEMFFPPSGVTYLLCQVPIVLSFLLTLMLLLWTRRLIKNNPNPSPLLMAYYINFRISLASDGFLFIGFLTGHLLWVAGFHSLSLHVDPLLSVILSLYMIRVGIPLVADNFRSLIDLPLPEKEMVKILKVITEFHHEYSGLGMLFSRRSGKEKIIELELFFDPSVSLEEISRIETQMGSRIGVMIPDVQFSLLARVTEKGS